MKTSIPHSKVCLTNVFTFSRFSAKMSQSKKDDLKEFDRRQLLKKQNSAPNIRRGQQGIQHELVAPLSVYRQSEESRIIPPLSVVDAQAKRVVTRKRDRSTSSLRNSKNTPSIAPLSVYKPAESDSKRPIAPMSVYKVSEEGSRAPVAPLSVYKPAEESKQAIAPLSVYKHTEGDTSPKVVAPLSVYKPAEENKSAIAPLSVYKPTEEPATTKMVAPLSVYRPPTEEPKSHVAPLGVYKQGDVSKSVAPLSVYVPFRFCDIY
jgi:hypothetical protein